MGEMELINRCLKKDDGAFEMLLSSYENKVYSLCYYLLKSKEDASDASQEVFIKIFKSIDKFKGDSKFSTWVYRITYNTCLDNIKRRREEVSYDDVIDSNPHKESKVEVIYESKELKQEIKNCILRLSEDFRSIIILRDINGLSYQEIAEILDIEVGTVKSRLNRAREALKKELIRRGIRG